ncbi:MAG TPA: DoxX family protein [Acidobacteriota bacterium]|nr:DoxX family protein [Acidobacteriota bacterium]
MRILESKIQRAWYASILVRLMVGAVFFTEGLQKFLFPALRGAGRFEKIGFPNPEFWGYFVGTFETVCGALVLLGLWTRLAAVPLVVIMLVAIVTTKIPILMGHGFGPFTVRDLPFYGFLSMAHEMRTDWSMLLGSLYLILVGGDPWSLDVMLGEKKQRRWNHL